MQTPACRHFRYSLVQTSSVCCLLRPVLHINHPLLRFADIADSLLSTTALFSRFYSPKIQTWATNAASYLARWILRSHMQYFIWNWQQLWFLGFTRWCRNILNLSWRIFVMCIIQNVFRNLTVKGFWKWSRLAKVIIKGQMSCYFEMMYMYLTLESVGWSFKKRFWCKCLLVLSTRWPCLILSWICSRVLLLSIFWVLSSRS